MPRKRDLYRYLPIHELETRQNDLFVRWLTGEHLTELEWIELQYLQLEKARRFRKNLVGECSCPQCQAWIAWREQLHGRRPTAD